MFHIRKEYQFIVRCRIVENREIESYREENRERERERERESGGSEKYRKQSSSEFFTQISIYNAGPALSGFFTYIVQMSKHHPIVKNPKYSSSSCQNRYCASFCWFRW